MQRQGQGQGQGQRLDNIFQQQRSNGPHMPAAAQLRTPPPTPRPPPPPPPPPVTVRPHHSFSFDDLKKPQTNKKKEETKVNFFEFSAASSISFLCGYFILFARRYHRGRAACVWNRNG
jgi:hypothetical protein